MTDMKLKGRGKSSPGEKSVNSKLTNSDIRDIRRLRKEGWTQVALGKRFGVSHPTIGCILRGKTWKHNKEEENGY